MSVDEFATHISSSFPAGKSRLIRNVPSEKVAWIIADMTRGTIQRRLLGQSDISPHEDSEFLLSFVWEALAMRERTPLSASLINRLLKLRMLGITGVRNASLDTPACTTRGVLVCNTVGGAAREATAEFALGLLLAAARAPKHFRQSEDSQLTVRSSISQGSSFDRQPSDR
jgi:phosphoglycerate dehydrogenase-like enzyme